MDVADSAGGLMSCQLSAHPGLGRSSSLHYARTMPRSALILFLSLGSCATPPIALAPSAAEVRPVVARDNIQGRWIVSQINGRQVTGLWLELGGEGAASITKIGNAVFVASPQPETKAFLGCNDWHPSGWTRNGDKLTLAGKCPIEPNGVSMLPRWPWRTRPVRSSRKP